MQQEGFISEYHARYVKTDFNESQQVLRFLSQGLQLAATRIYPKNIDDEFISKFSKLLIYILWLNSGPGFS